MKRNILLGILAIVLVLGFTVIGCDLGDDSQSNGNRPAAPVLSGSYTATQTFLSWTTVPGAIEYEVHISTSQNPNSHQRIATVTGTSYTHNTTQPFNYTVRAWTSNGYSPFSNYINTY